jgi:hypothetical protein
MSDSWICKDCVQPKEENDLICICRQRHVPYIDAIECSDCNNWFIFKFIVGFMVFVLVSMLGSIKIISGRVHHVLL